MHTMRLTPAVFVFVLLAGAASGALKPLEYKDCGSKMGKVQSVFYNGTGESKIAELKKGTTLQLQIKVLSNDNSKTLHAVVHGIIKGISINFPLDNPNACVDCGVSCPISSSKDYTYTPVIYVKPIYPSIRLTVKWEVKDDKDDDLFCIVIPAVIED